MSDQERSSANLPALSKQVSELVLAGSLLTTILIFIGEAVRDALDPKKTFR